MKSFIKSIVTTSVIAAAGSIAYKLITSDKGLVMTAKVLDFVDDKINDLSYAIDDILTERRENLGYDESEHMCTCGKEEFEKLINKLKADKNTEATKDNVEHTEDSSDTNLFDDITQEQQDAEDIEDDEADEAMKELLDEIADEEQKEREEMEKDLEEMEKAFSDEDDKEAEEDTTDNK